MEEITYQKVLPSSNSPIVIIRGTEDFMKKTKLASRPTYIPPHWHRSIEFSLIIKGVVRLWINNNEKILHENDFIFVNSAQVHKLDTIGEENEVLVVLISYEFLQSVVPDIDSIFFDLNKPSDKKERLYEIYQFFYEHSIHPHPLDNIKINAYAYELIYILLSDFQSCTLQKDDILTKQRQHRILNYVEEHFKDDLSLSVLSDVAHMNKTYFSRWFKSTFGVNYKEYLMNYRLFQSINDILHTKKSIQYIAYTNGFSSTKSFINTFKLHYDMTPYQYRKQYNENKNN